jgi:hypothetical protein
LLALLDVMMLACGFNALAAKSRAPGVWTLSKVRSTALYNMIAMWSERYQIDPNRLQYANPGDPLDERLSGYGIGSYFAGRHGAGLLTTTFVRLILNQRPSLVHVPATQSAYGKMLYYTNDTTGAAVYKFGSRQPKPVARIGVAGGWLYAVELRRGLTEYELFTEARAVLAALHGQRRSKEWSGVLLPSVAYAGVRQVGWLNDAIYNNDLFIGGAFQSMEIGIELPEDLPVVASPKVDLNEPPLAVFNGWTLLFQTDRRHRIKWLCQYGRQDWATYTS